MKSIIRIVTIGFTIIGLGCRLSAQTCQDGCFYSNTYQGDNALLNFGAGGNDTAFGAYALTSSTGLNNTAIGAYTLQANTSGLYNTALGSSALYSNVTGQDNVAAGVNALYSNTEGVWNVAIGSYALDSNTSGSANVAIGQEALQLNTTGQYNVATGLGALANNTTGIYNTAVGNAALEVNSTANQSTAVGAYALGSSSTGANNVAVGYGALLLSETGSNNTALGTSALSKDLTGSSNTAVGYQALSASTGKSNIALGESAGINLTSGSNNIDIGNKGIAGESNTIRIGKKGTQTTTMIAGVRGVTVAGGVAVLVDGDGRLGTTTSSGRFKEQIKPMAQASEAIFSLEPVTFRYKKELDPSGIPQFGLVAEEVEKVDRDLVVRDDEGKPCTVRYEAINAMLLNEFLKEHRKVEELIAAFTRHEQNYQSTIAELQSELREQTAQIQQVNQHGKTTVSPLLAVSRRP